jgi:ABC-type transport system involved in multi-copper enzyme maturation permease subunit
MSETQTQPQPPESLIQRLGHQLLPPIFFKDVKMALRRPRAGLLQLLFLGACMLVTYAIWPRQGVYSVAAQDSHHLFTVLGIGQLALVALFAPAFTSPAFTVEQERNTFDLLYGSQMTPFAIVWGKVLGGITFLMLIVLSSIPVVSACYVLGAINPGSII